MRSKVILLITGCFLFSYSGFSQTLGKKIKDVKLKGVAQVSVDRLGNFFVIARNGSIKKFDAQGKEVASLKHGHPTLLEPWFHPIIFLYNQKNQSIYSYGRHFENERITPLDPAWAIEPQLVCPTNDNKIWIYDGSDASLKKVNPLTQEVINEFSIDTIQLKSKPRFTHLREYQSMLFLLDPTTGIFIFNNIGKLVNHVNVSGLLHFNFFGEELYYLHDHKIIFYDLYSEEKRSIAVEGDFQFVLVTDERILLIHQKKGSLFEFNPQPNEK
ncbi:MAG: hypothetical protein HYZ44_13675 [Bacteroidetes bacterium]|nr:hypothetical protein [Bacteroidota bacterium]